MQCHDAERSRRVKVSCVLSSLPRSLYDQRFPPSVGRPVRRSSLVSRCGALIAEYTRHLHPALAVPSLHSAPRSFDCSNSNRNGEIFFEICFLKLAKQRQSRRSLVMVRVERGPRASGVLFHSDPLQLKTTKCCVWSFYVERTRRSNCDV